ncbi:oxygenase MpaB family protein [Phytoactinopolyspora endophytica]|uniref:oxygenase MpaB family protein n=1 Tax=Phytoactinopolyspora endophytica TaxID=1642495 RepID=UPI00101BD773|nr:oxygenase MpaB family protein [Phytoactinopolyspora endophytica]
MSASVQNSGHRGTATTPDHEPDCSARAPDLGLFGPDSVSWRVHREPILWLAGLRALYLQALHPRAVAGVVQNSDFRRDCWTRLMRTAEYVTTVVYGTTDDAQRAAERIRRIHDALRAHDPETGEEYRVDEPHLLRWVHVNEVESFLSTAQRAGVRLSDDEVDRYYTEQLRAAELVGLDPAIVPASAAEVDEYYRTIRPELALTPAARDVALFLTVPPMPRKLSWTIGRPAWLTVAGTAFALLPRWARRLYRTPGFPTTDLSATLTIRGMRGVISALPIREGPIYREAMRRAELGA